MVITCETGTRALEPCPAEIHSHCLASVGSNTQGHVTVTAVVGRLCCACTHLLTSRDLVTMARTVTRAVAGWIIVMACIVPQTG